MTFSETVMWNDSYIQVMLKYRNMHLKDFIKAGGNCELHQAIKDSKVGYIKITKISSNGGYLAEGDSEEGITAAFGEGVGLYIAGVEQWYKTTTIRNIFWDEGEFTTMNSRYKFEFTEIDYRPILEELKNESTSN
jgi:hypothetical protein